VIANGPGSIGLIYPAFSTSAVAQTTSFTSLCTTSMPYTLAISPTSGTLVGVNYDISVSAGGVAGSPSCAGAQCDATGTGASQPYTVTVTAPPGQSGTCTTGTCSSTQLHTLTITY
jgi:hypothetical protein